MREIEGEEKGGEEGVGRRGKSTWRAFTVACPCMFGWEMMKILSCEMLLRICAK